MKFFLLNFTCMNYEIHVKLYHFRFSTSSRKHPIAVLPQSLNEDKFGHLKHGLNLKIQAEFGFF